MKTYEELMSQNEKVLDLLEAMQDVIDALRGDVARLTAERDEARRQLDLSKARQEHLTEIARCDRRDREIAQARVRMVNCGAEDVWFWQEDGGNEPESLACPVVMRADTLRKILAERDEATAKERAAVVTWLAHQTNKVHSAGILSAAIERGAHLVSP